MHNDAVMMRIDSDTGFDAFMQNWTTIRAQIP